MFRMCMSIADWNSSPSGGSIGGAMGAIAPPYGLKKKLFFNICIVHY